MTTPPATPPTTASDPSWAIPGTYQVAPGVHRIPLALPGDGLKAVNVYAIEDGAGIALVDAGSFHPETLTGLRDGLASIGARIEDVHTVLATHAHYDHYGLASRLRSMTGATLMLGAEELPLLLVALDHDAFMAWMAERRDWLIQHDAANLLPAVENFERHQQLEATRDESGWQKPDRLLADGERVELASRTLTVQWTPGHSRGHIVYHDPANDLLFAGDHVLPHITPSIGFEPLTDGLALDLFLASLTAVRDSPEGLVLPGHGHPFHDLPGRVDELLAHHATRLDGCVAGVTQIGVASASRVAAVLPWTRHNRSFASLDPFNQMLAVGETIAHLELLVRADRVQHVELEGAALAYAVA